MIALISDIHANIEALEAVFQDIDRLGVKEIHCLGDVVGYGASPVDCVVAVQERTGSWLRGNHEHGLLFYAQDFNPRARAALDWTRDRINQEPRAKRREIWNALDATPETLSIEGGRVLLVHGSPRDPVREYVLPRSSAEPQLLSAWFESMGDHQVCFLGHSHVPFVIFAGGRLFLPEEDLFTVDVGTTRCIVNVGSVGQPRDGDPRGCYATLEGGELTFRRVPYDVKSAMERIRAVPEIPNGLADRLELGR